MKDKRSFFERLTGTVRVDDEPVEDAAPESSPARGNRTPARSIPVRETAWTEEEVDGELSVDVYQTQDAIVIKTIVAGVNPEDLDISITRDAVTIRGKREVVREVTDGDYLYKELYWGSFSRTVVLPQEIEVEEAEAVQKHGLLTITLPKIDKTRQTKLKVRVS